MKEAQKALCEVAVRRRPSTTQGASSHQAPNLLVPGSWASSLQDWEAPSLRYFPTAAGVDSDMHPEVGVPNPY